MKVLIKCEKIIKHYNLGKVTVPALRGIDLQVKSGEYIAILGPSGSGKSTLMNILGCLDNPDEGYYLLDDEDVTHLDRNQLAYVRNKKIGFIFQDFNLLGHATSLENVMLPLVYRRVSQRERKVLAEEMLTQVGLQNRLHHLPNELSGGQRQRVAIARALVTKPDLILADEPTGNLDSKTGDEVIALFEKLTEQGRTVIIVTHDLGLANRAKRVIQIKDGLISSDTVNGKILSES